VANTTGKRIKDIRVLRGYTQKYLSDKIGIAEGLLQKYEYGERIPKKERLKEIANALDVHVSFLQPFDLTDYSTIYAYIHDLIDAYGDIVFENKGSTIFIGVEGTKQRALLNKELFEAKEMHEKLSTSEFQKWLINYRLNSKLTRVPIKKNK